ncbi:DNase I-like protein [Marasmius fiardii PR-910]|nr:DNase I-like protein [Marasmius fiardii PR-910]
MSTESPEYQPERPQLLVQTKNSSQQTVLSRLQGLFPNPPSSSGSPVPSANDLGGHPRPGSSQRVHNLPKSLKVRILTWNMHDSVPKGDLEELFGKVPFYTPSTASTSLPQFASDTEHPYHLIVVAGQECPSSSGIPMGLGTGFKLYDRDKEDREKDDKPRSLKNGYKEEAIRSKKSYEDLVHDSPPSGWTSMIEDWLCYGGSATRIPEASEISGPKRLSPRIVSKEPKKGPYQLLCKERLLGIYLAIYIHRDVRRFVRGTSKSTVTSGLMGGRWGNKGGVGISMNIDGKTFLFLNCHLAAQQEKANLNDRLNNYNKIKAELAVDDFLSSDDPRMMSEDITDKFDYTFVFGDLNFRLDISRLHADWLIARQDYAQALAFDQLRNLMQNGRAFVGFHEAPINFPPTFKYDVLRTLKGVRRRQLKLERWKSDRVRQRITEVTEQDLADYEEDADKSSDEGDGEGEVASVASSVWTSTNSRLRQDQDQEEGYAGMTRSSSSKLSISVSVAAQKARTKWLTLLSPTSGPASPTRWLRSKSSLVDATPTSRNHPADCLEEVIPDVKIPREGSDGSMDLAGEVMLVPPPPLGRASSSKSNSSLQSDDDDDEDSKGVYDTSSKKRVPSWCDRILWKSTVEPDPDPEVDDSESHFRPRNRVGQFLANAFRPLSSRSRRSSVASVATSGASSTVTAGTSTNSDSPLPSPELLESIIPFSRFVYPDTRSAPHQSIHLNSVENLTPGDAKNIPPENTSREMDAGLPQPQTPSVSSPSVSKRTSGILSSDSPTSQRDHNLPTSRWRFLQSFINHNHSGSASSDNSVGAPVPSIKPPRKGDIVCLSYNTLDDRGMRRLEGRSDHRPVIGSYAVCL